MRALLGRPFGSEAILEGQVFIPTAEAFGMKTYFKFRPDHSGHLFMTSLSALMISIGKT